MHFGKTYKELLSSLPPELREDAIEYRQLKKLIRKVVNELAVLGLSPDVLHRVLQATASGKLTRASLIDSEPSSAKGKEKARDTYGPPPAELAELAELERVLDAGGGKLEIVQVLYELDVKEDLIEPRLRVRIGPPPTEEPSSSAAAVTPSDVSTPDTLHDLASENDDHPITSPDNVGSPPPSLNE